MARHVEPLKLGSKPAQLYVRLRIIPLSHLASEPRQLGNYKALCSSSLFLTFCLTGYQSAQFIRRALHYASGSRKLIRQSAHVYMYIIIIMSCRQHRYPWPSLATSSYRSSPLAGLQGYIPYPHRAAVCMFELVVLLLLGHMLRSIRVHHLRARLCFSSSVLHIWFV